MKIFYSWQMDAPRKINKDFIHAALSDAIDQIGKNLDVSEAERDVLELDQDTQGVLGSPEVSRVILEKIASSHIVVTDVSLVARGREDKPHINSNVAIELGYAYGKLGDHAVLKIMNNHYGMPNDLPFDLRNRRHPISYTLAPDADKASIEEERRKLTGILKKIIKIYLIEGGNERRKNHFEAPFIDLRGKYWENSDPLVPKDLNRNRSQEIFWKAESVIYFRCIPMTALPELSAAEAIDFTGNLKPLLSMNGPSRSRNKWGAISYEGTISGGGLIGATQLFKNREIWGIDATYSEHKTSTEQGEVRRIIPTGAIQSNYPRAIESIRQLADKLGYGDSYIIEMGFSGAQGAYLTTRSTYFDRCPGPFYDNEVFFRKKVSSDYPTLRIMNDFWQKLFPEVAHKVPDKLIWKPE